VKISSEALATVWSASFQSELGKGETEEDAVRVASTAMCYFVDSIEEVSNHVNEFHSKEIDLG